MLFTSIIIIRAIDLLSLTFGKISEQRLLFLEKRGPKVNNYQSQAKKFKC